MLHSPIRTIYQSRNVTWMKRMYYQQELDEYNEDFLPLTQEYVNNNDEQDNDTK